MGKLIDYINKNLSLEDEYKMIFGREIPSGKFICPNPGHSHVNHTPSCKAYGNVFKCFGQCNRVFGVYDLLKWYNPKRIDEIKSSIIIEETVDNSVAEIIKVEVDRSQSLSHILFKITGICLSSLK